MKFSKLTNAVIDVAKAVQDLIDVVYEIKLEALKTKKKNVAKIKRLRSNKTQKESSK